MNAVDVLSRQVAIATVHQPTVDGTRRHVDCTPRPWGASAVVDDVLSATDGRSVVMVSHRLDARSRFEAVLDLRAHHPAAPAPKE